MAGVLKQAMAESRRRGKAEEKLEVAMKMMETGLGFDEIYMFTGMRREEIMFELDGLISAAERAHQQAGQPGDRSVDGSAVRQADQQERQQADQQERQQAPQRGHQRGHQRTEQQEPAKLERRMDMNEALWTGVEVEGMEGNRGEALWTEMEAEGMEGNRGGALWTEMEIERMEGNRGEALWTEMEVEGMVANRGGAPWTEMEVEGREIGMNERPSMKGDGTKGNGPKGDGSKIDGPKGDGPKIDGSKGDGSKGDGSAMDGAVMDGAVMVRAQAVRTEADGTEAVGVNVELKEALIVWRREQFRAEGVRAYMVMPQRTLLEIARKIPKTRDELMAVYGFGDARWEKYGERILEITSGF